MTPPTEMALRAEFLRRLAHELRAPITLVSHVLECVHEEVGSDLSEELRATTRLAAGAVRRFERLAARLDLMAELESDAPEEALQRTDLVAIVERGVAQCQAIERRRDVVLTSELVKAPCLVRGNPGRLEVVVTELVHNAIRHGRRRVLVRLQRTDAEARLSVEDDGKGVAQDLRLTLLERTAPPRGRTGLGLGLSIVSEVVRTHGGHLVSEDSTFGGFDPGTTGARFVVSLAVEA